MPAKHTKEEEYKMCVITNTHEPSYEYYGICSCCMGSGYISDFDRPSFEEQCYKCGGDGKSELEE